MRILFLGESPSQKAPDKAFLTTKSGDRLLQLISTASLPFECVNFANVIERLPETGKNPKRKDFIKAGKSQRLFNLLTSHDIVYVCGELPKLAVDQVNPRYLGPTRIVVIPHPSPRNRLWNDPMRFNIVARKIKDSYESKVAENRKRSETGRDLPDDRLRGDDLQGKTEPICPVVKDFERRKKEDNGRGSSRVGGADIRQGGR